jgi:hypothetical protein
MKKLPDHLKDGIGTALDDCSWDYAAPKPIRRFFLNPMSAFFGDFPWEGRKSKNAQTQAPQSFTLPEANSDQDIPE